MAILYNLFFFIVFNFLKLSNITPVFKPVVLSPHPPELMPSKWGLVMDRVLVLCRQFSDTLTQTQEFLWRLLDLHIVKMVAFYTVWVALGEVTTSSLLIPSQSFQALFRIYILRNKYKLISSSH